MYQSQKHLYSKDTVFEHDHKKPLPNLLDEETKLDAQEIKPKFKVSTSNSWIQKFMKSNYYSIIDNASVLQISNSNYSYFKHLWLAACQRVVV